MNFFFRTFWHLTCYSRITLVGAQKFCYLNFAKLSSSVNCNRKSHKNRKKTNSRTYALLIFSVRLISINNLIPIQTLVSSRSFIKIPILIISIALFLFISISISIGLYFKDQSCELEKNKLVSTFSQSRKITGVFCNLAIFFEQQHCGGSFLALVFNYPFG